MKRAGPITIENESIRTGATDNHLDLIVRLVVFDKFHKVVMSMVKTIMGVTKTELGSPTATFAMNADSNSF